MKSKKLLRHILSMLTIFVMIFSTGCGVNQKEIDEKHEIGIMSYNIYHCGYFYGGEVNYEEFANVINLLGADVVGMQEVRNGGKTEEFGNQTEILAKKCNFKFHHFGKAIERPECDYGNGIMSKITIEKVDVFPIIVEDKQPGYEDRCVIKAKLKNGLTIIVSHFGVLPQEQKRAVEVILSLIEEEKCVLMGDFNVKPGNEVLNPIKEKMRDTAEIFNTDLKSWPANDPTDKLDYIFVSKDIEVLSADIPEIKCSDHLPYIARIKF